MFTLYSYITKTSHCVEFLLVLQTVVSENYCNNITGDGVCVIIGPIKAGVSFEVGGSVTLPDEPPQWLQPAQP